MMQCTLYQKTIMTNKIIKYRTIFQEQKKQNMNQVSCHVRAVKHLGILNKKDHDFFEVILVYLVEALISSIARK